MAPMADVTYKDVQRGPMLVDRRGRMVWYDARTGLDLRRADPELTRASAVLTRWYGELIGGYGAGVGQIIDETYKTVATVGNETQLPLDLHEFNLTSRGTALATHYETSQRRPLLGRRCPRTASLLVGHALEIDIATNKVLLDWVSIDHVGPRRELPTAPGHRQRPPTTTSTSTRSPRRPTATC